jgi:hypothetical protein
MDGELLMDTHPNYRGTVLGLVIIIVVCGFIVFTPYCCAIAMSGGRGRKVFGVGRFQKRLTE